MKEEESTVAIQRLSTTDWRKTIKKQFVIQNGTHHYYLGSEFISDQDMGSVVNQIQQNEDEYESTGTTQIHLWYNSIGFHGCKYFSRLNLDILAQLYLSNNTICDKGLRYLQKGCWCQLTVISLKDDNSITDEGCRHLVRSYWPKLTCLRLNMNSIGTMGCRFLSQAPWDQDIEIQLGHNQIQKAGYRFLKDKYRYLTCDNAYK